MKLLSIIVPTYNMEGYLAQCIDSILRTPSLAALEVVIVNDGSRDRSLRIARGYAERYADTVRIIDKENGNYGSTINAALPTLQGEYVKILDADDRFDGGKIAEFVASLKALQGVDMVVSPFVEWNGKREHRIDYNIYGRKVYDYGKRYEADKIFGDGAIRFFMMHSVCYRTELLREIHYHQSEGISYTDQEWVFYPLFRVKTIAFVDIPLYRYNAAREGQTMDRAVQLRSLAQLEAVTKNMAQYFIEKASTLESEPRCSFLRNIVADRMRIIYRKYLLAMNNAQFSASHFAESDATLSLLAEQCGIERLAVPVNNLLKVDLLRQWRKRGRRYSTTFRWLLQFADGTMTTLHSALFR